MKVELTNLDRPLLDGFTKRDLIDYYVAVAPAILPQLTGRPLSLVRFPAGLEGRGFLQNECRGAPEWMRTATLELQGGRTRRYCVVDDLDALVWVANLTTVEIHPYRFDCERPDVPLAVMLDLDAGPGTTILDACRVALALFERRPDAIVKTSGVTGLHVELPGAADSFPAARELARSLAEAVAAEDPTVEPVANARKPGQILIDWRQNHDRRSTVAAYSLRATIPLGVSTPVGWDEVADALAAGDPRALRFTPAAVLARL
jgi:bifunctional non-homologous end joining protein LigD